MCQEFVQMPPNRQKEIISNVISAVLVPVNGRHVFPGVRTTFEGLQRINKIEVKISNDFLKFNSPNTTIIKGVAVPNWMKKSIEEHIKRGDIITSKDLSAWVERIETPLISAVTQAITAVAEKSKHMPTISPAREAQIALNQAALQVERKKRVQEDVLCPLAQQTQLVPAVKIGTPPTIQSHDYYRQARAKAVEDTKLSSKITSCTYQLVPVAERWVKDKRIVNVDAWKVCNGLPVQQAIHSESVLILNGTATLHYSNPSERVHAVTDSIANVIQLIHEANTRNAIRESCALTDVCWALLDYGCAIGEGVVEGAGRVCHMARHPAETITAIGQAAYNVAYVLCELEAIADIATYPADKQVTKETLQAYIHKIDAVQKALRENMSKMSGPDMVRAGVAMGTDILLTGRITAAVIPLFSLAKSRIVEIAKDVIGVAPEAVLLGRQRLILHQRCMIRSPRCKQIKQGKRVQVLVLQ